MPKMEFVVGFDLEDHKKYYRTLDDLHNYYRKLELTDVTYGELSSTEEGIIKRDPSHLIIWKKNSEIIGHAVWHEASTDEHREGQSRDREDRKVLRELCGGKKENIVELHEVWLRKKYRGKGYGKQFFDYFEDFIRKKGFNFIVYYTDHPAAIAICKNRGWKEGFLAEEKWYVFCQFLSC